MAASEMLAGTWRKLQFRGEEQKSVNIVNVIGP